MKLTLISSVSFCVGVFSVFTAASCMTGENIMVDGGWIMI